MAAPELLSPLHSAGQFYLLSNAEPFSGHIRGFVRVFVADQQELTELSSKRESELKMILTSPDRMVSEANEIRAYDFLAKRFVCVYNTRIYIICNTVLYSGQYGLWCLHYVHIVDCVLTDTGIS